MIGKDRNAARVAKHKERKSFKGEDDGVELLLANVPVKLCRTEFL